MGKTSLERSHSKASNFKLTLMCILAAIGFNLIFAGLALYNKNNVLGLILAIAGGVMSIFFYILIRGFTR